MRCALDRLVQRYRNRTVIGHRAICPMIKDNRTGPDAGSCDVEVMHVSLPTTHLLQCVSRPTSRGKRAKRFEASRVKRGIGDVDGRGGDGGAARPVSTGAAEASISWSRSSTFDRPMPDTTWHQTTTTPSCVASDTRPQEGTALCSRPFLFAADAMDLWIPTVAEMIIAEKIGAKWHVPTTWAVIEITDAQLLLLGCRTCGWARVFRCPRNESIVCSRNGRRGRHTTCADREAMKMAERWRFPSLLQHRNQMPPARRSAGHWAHAYCV